MPVVGMPLGFVAPSWSCSRVGIVFWADPGSVMTHRLFFADALPERAGAQHLILLAPPAVAARRARAGGGRPASSATSCSASRSSIAALTASLLDRILRTHFAIGWWR
jgi:hypothetical protein